MKTKCFTQIFVGADVGRQHTFDDVPGLRSFLKALKLPPGAGLRVFMASWTTDQEREDLKALSLGAFAT